MPAQKRHIALILVILAAALICGYRLYMGQETHAHLLTGTVEATRIDVSTKESGYIEELLLREGMTVQAGDTAARISRRDLDAALLRDRAALAHAEAGLARIESGSRPEEIRAAQERTNAARAAAARTAADYARGAALLAAGAIAQQNFDALREARDTAAANLRVAEKQQTLTERGSRLEDVRMAQEDVHRQQAIVAIDEAVIGDLTITVPRDGIVLTKNYEQGEYVRAGAAIATLMDPADLRVKVYVTTDVLSRLHVGDAARVFIDGQEAAFAGRVAEISDAAEFTLRQSITKNERANLVFAVKIAVENGAGILKPGMPADVDLAYGHGT